jgi:anti-sigma regulatory factor (Ser/Thr protein kinase)
MRGAPPRGVVRPKRVLQTYRTFLASPAAVGLARDLVERLAAQWGVEVLGHDLSTVVGELAGNAVEVSRNDAVIHVHMRRERTGIMVAVWDASDEEPRSRAVEWTLDLIDALPDDHEFGGWGLPIVERLCASTGIAPTPPNGKWVWGLLPLPNVERSS